MSLKSFIYAAVAVIMVVQAMINDSAVMRVIGFAIALVTATALAVTLRRDHARSTDTPRERDDEAKGGR